jgi:predicted metalloprotease with PDZ domain
MVPDVRDTAPATVPEHVAGTIVATLDLSAREQHLVTVALQLPADLLVEGGRLVMPTWTPGSYVVRDYVHHLQRITLRDGSGGPVPLAVDGVSAWRIPALAPGRGPVTVELEWYAYDLSVRTNSVDDDHVLLLGAATFPYLEGARALPHHILITGLRPDDVVTSLLPGTDAGPYCAEDHQHLVDAAFAVGAHRTAVRVVAGVEHRVVWAGRVEAVDVELLADDLAVLADAAVALFGGELPAPRYTVIAVDGEGGGLEHRDGCVVALRAEAVADPDRRQRIAGLLSHEHLHLWNVRRMAPVALVDPDLEHPVVTPSLWIAEGWTSYYDRVLPTRAGLRPVDGLLEDLSGLRSVIDRTPGATLQSLHDASRSAWTKHYRRDENAPNAGTDYYAHGALVAFELDLRLRRHDPDGDGLDAVLRELWHRFGTRAGRPLHGYTEADVLELLAQAGGDTLATRCVELTSLPGAPDLEPHLCAVGLRLEHEPLGPPELGMLRGPDPSRVVVRSVLRGGAAWRAGVSGGDVLIAIDEALVRADTFDAALRRLVPGSTVQLSLERGRRLLHRTVALGPAGRRSRITLDEGAPQVAREAFTRWCGQAFPAG